MANLTTGTFDDDESSSSSSSEIVRDETTDMTQNHHDSLMTSKQKKIRKSGLDFPLSIAQICACSIHCVSIILFMTFRTWSKMDHALYVALHLETLEWVYVVLCAFLLCHWITCETMDPSDLASSRRCWFTWDLSSYSRWHKSRYCACCRKLVPGLDHHCLWLNTCIGARNYVNFLCICFSGLLLMCVQALTWIAALVLNYTRIVGETAPARSSTNVRLQGWTEISVGVCSILSLVMASAYACIGGFHAYLVVRNMSTYDWLVGTCSFTPTILNECVISIRIPKLNPIIITSHILIARRNTARSSTEAVREVELTRLGKT